MDFNGKRKPSTGGGTKFDSDESGPLVYPVNGHATPLPATLPACEPSLPAKLVVHWTVLAGGVLFFVSCLLLFFVIMPSLRGIHEGLRQEREALEKISAGRVGADVITRDAAKQITLQQAAQLQQLQQFRTSLEELNRLANRIHPKE